MEYILVLFSCSFESNGVLVLFFLEALVWRSISPTCNCMWKRERCYLRSQRWSSLVLFCLFLQLCVWCREDNLLVLQPPWWWARLGFSFCVWSGWCAAWWMGCSSRVTTRVRGRGKCCRIIRGQAASTHKKNGPEEMYIEEVRGKRESKAWHLNILC